MHIFELWIFKMSYDLLYAILKGVGRHEYEHQNHSLPPAAARYCCY